MKKIKSSIQKALHNAAGISLVELSIFLIALGMLFAAGAQIYDTWKTYEALETTASKMETIDNAIMRYVEVHGRYPCPASLEAGFDTAGFGAEVGDVITAADETNYLDYEDYRNCGGNEDNGPSVYEFPGTQRVAGENSQDVVTGAVPVRALGLPDEYIYDGYRQRYVYSVTLPFTDYENAPVGNGAGAIAVIDDNDNNTTHQYGNIVHLVLSHGYDTNGAFNALGGPAITQCDASAKGGQNCDYHQNAVFMNTLAKSTNEGDPDSFFVHRMKYHSENCTAGTGRVPKDVSFLLDTSGSMASSEQCPTGMTGGCTRMNVAQWAIRRTLPARIHQSHTSSDDPGKTGFSGFTPSNNASQILQNIQNNPNFHIDTPDMNYTPEDTLQTVENRLQAMCPSGNTPLGVHADALARELNYDDEQELLARIAAGDPEIPTDPEELKQWKKDNWAYRKVVVISDGISNSGEDPVSVARRIKDQYPNTEVDVIDMIATYCNDEDDNPDNNCSQSQLNVGQRQLAELTGGKYYAVKGNPDGVGDGIGNALGVCLSSSPLGQPVDHKYCN